MDSSLGLKEKKIGKLGLENIVTRKKNWKEVKRKRDVKRKLNNYERGEKSRLGKVMTQIWLRNSWEKEKKEKTGNIIGREKNNRKSEGKKQEKRSKRENIKNR